MSQEATDSLSDSSWSLSKPEDETAGQNEIGLQSFLVAPPKPSKKLKAKSVKEVLEKVLPQLQRRDQYQFFAIPVEPAEVPEYYSIIQEPMDFSTMERKLEADEYKSVEEFKDDFLLITGNAQYFNVLDGPSGIIHTEAKKLQEWGLRVITREGAAVRQETDNEPEEIASPMKKAAAAKAGKLAIRIKKLTSPQSSAVATPRTATPSRLNQEIKMEEDEDNDNDSGEDSDASSNMGTSSGRGASTSIDGFNTPGGGRASPETVRKYTKRAIGPRAPYTHKKNRPRSSAVLGLLSTSANTSNEDLSEGRAKMAPVSSTSGAVASVIPLVFGPDGSIELGKLTEDERRAILRSADLDDWPDLLMPYLLSILPLHTEAQPNAQVLARTIRAMVDGFGSAVLGQPTPISSSINYDVSSLPPDQQKSPFAISSGHIFASLCGKADIPLAWPRPTNTSSNTGASSSESTSRILKGRDREKEREAAGVGNLDDWSFPRAYLTKLLGPLDLGLYPGLLPSAWINHIKLSKGGPAKSRLPPFHLSMGPTFELALQDELSSLPHRVLLNGKPGMVNTNAAQAAEIPREPCTAITEGIERDWKMSEEEEVKAGVRGSDVIREVVFGGALGEAYASSVLDFVQGASLAAQSRQDQSTKEEEDVIHYQDHRIHVPSQVKVEVKRVVPSYFDDSGDMLDAEGYIGAGLIPLEVRKEAGLSDHLTHRRNLQGSPISLDSPIDKKRRSRGPSVALAVKRQRMASTPFTEQSDVKMEDEEEKFDDDAEQDNVFDDLTSAYLSGAILEKSLIEYTRDTVISPLTDGLLDTLVRAGEEVERLECHGKPALTSSESSLNAITEHIGSLLDDSMQDLEGLLDSSPKVEETPEIDVLVRKLLTSDYHQLKSFLAELLRAIEYGIDLDTMVRSKEEMLNEIQQTQVDNLGLPLRWTSMEMDSAKVNKSLEQYAKILDGISIRREKDQSLAYHSLTTDELAERETLDKLRLAYISLAKLAPSRQICGGQWAAWAEYLQQQMAQQKSSQ